MMSSIFTYVSAENYKFFKSKLWKFSLLIVTLFSLFMIMSIHKDNDWKNNITKTNQEIAVQLKMTPYELEQTFKSDSLIKEWKENNAYLKANIKPATIDTIQGYLSEVMSLKGLGLIVIAFTIIFAVSIAKEFESGTIKFMMISPYSRVKVILGKYLNVLLVSFLFLFSVLLINALIAFFFMDMSDSVRLLYVNGEIISISIYGFMVKNILLSLIYYLVYTTFAFMLATLFRSVSISLSISLLFALLGTQLIGLFNVSSKIKQYILPAIVDLTHYQGSQTLVEANNYSLLSCLIIILVYMATFLLITVTTFKNRDI